MSQPKFKPCPDSPRGNHVYEPDLEYDISGCTVNCIHCGEAQPLKGKFPRLDKLRRTKLYVICTFTPDGEPETIPFTNYTDACVEYNLQRMVYKNTRATMVTLEPWKGLSNG